MLTVEDLRKRLERLEALSSEVALERAVIRTADDPLRHRERRRYLVALEDARFGVEAARIVLDAALRRLEEGASRDRRFPRGEMT